MKKWIKKLFLKLIGIDENTPLIKIEQIDINLETLEQ